MRYRDNHDEKKRGGVGRLQGVVVWCLAFGVWRLRVVALVCSRGAGDHGGVGVVRSQCAATQQFYFRNSM